MTKKNIAIITHSFLPIMGGLQYELKWIVDSMDQLCNSKEYSDIRICLLVPNKEALKYCHFRNIKAINTNRPSHSGISGIKYFKYILLLNNLCKKNKIDIVHTQSAGIESLFFLIIQKIFQKELNYIITSHGIDIAYDKRINYGMRCKRLWRLLIQKVLKNAIMHINISRAMIEFAKEAGSCEDKIKLIPNGLKPVDKNIDKDIKQKLVEKYNIKDTDICYLSMSGMRPVKGLINLVKGFSESCKRNTNLKLFLAAEGQQTQVIKNMIHKLRLEGSVMLIGFMGGEEKKAWFDICHVYCNVAIFEPFGIVILEAMDYGLGIIGSVEGGIKDYIKNNINGILIKPHDIKTITSAILKMSNNRLREELIQNAKKDVKKYYIDNITKQYLNLYKNIK